MAVYLPRRTPHRSIRWWRVGFALIVGIASIGLVSTSADGVASASTARAVPGTARGNAAALAAGSLFNCVIDELASLRCWGRGTSGVLGRGDTTDIGDQPSEMGNDLPAVDLGTGRTPRSVTTGDDHACAVLDDATFKCWGASLPSGAGMGGNLGDQPGEMGDNLAPVDVGTGRSVISASAGRFHTCALLDDGSVKCWGWNSNAELGIGDRQHRGDAPGEMGDNLPAVELGTGRTAVAVTTGGGHSCALLDDGSVKCWGFAASTGLGRGGPNDLRIGDEPGEMGDNLDSVDLGAGRTAVAIDAGESSTCAILDTGALKCWGLNGAGELGQGHTDDIGDDPGEMGDSLAPIDLGPGRTARAVSLARSSTCALLDDDTVKCWGWGLNGQNGQGTTADIGDQPGEMGASLPAIDLGTGRTARAVGNGYSQTCALLDNDTVKCWGSGFSGALGQGSTDHLGDQPGEMGDDLPAIDLGGYAGDALDVEAGGAFTCAQLIGDDTRCWGIGDVLGNGQFDDVGDDQNELGVRLRPIDVGSGRTVAAMSSGFRHSCAVLDNSAVKCWGRGNAGQLGYGDTDDRGDGANEMGDSLPIVDLGTGRTARGLTASTFDHTCAVLDNDEIKCWGNNTSGQLGYGDTDDRGDDPNEMGNNLPTVDLGNAYVVADLDGGLTHTCTRSPAGVKCWGANDEGQLGLGDTNARGDGPNEMGNNLPTVDLGTGRTPDAIQLGDDHSCAILDDGSVKCWGRNSEGQLGYGDTNARGDGPNEMGNNLPTVDLGPGRTAIRISAGDDHTCALLDTTSIVCWGDGFNGRLGNGGSHNVGDGPGEMGSSLAPVAVRGIRVAAPPGAPAAPAAPSGTPGDRSVGLSWAVPTDNGGITIIGYRIESSSGNNQWSVAVANTGQTTSATVPGLTNGSAYRFRVSALNFVGASPPSPPSLAVTPMDPPPATPAITSLAPERFADTRANGDTLDGLFERSGSLAAGSEFRVQIGGRGAVPMDARSVVANITAVGPSSVGFVTAHPCITPRPLASSLNYSPNVNLGNEIIAPLTASGELCLYTSGAIHLTVDVVGFVDQSSPAIPTTPGRFLDTRPTGTTVDGLAAAAGLPSGGSTTRVPIAGRGTVPVDAVAVIVNVTVVNPTGNGFVTAHPCQPQAPLAASLNFVNGINRGNELIATLDSNGDICLFASTAAHLTADVVGYVAPATGLGTVGPARLLDTRATGATLDGISEAIGQLGAGTRYTLQVGGRANVPANATSVVVNVTAVGADGLGFVTADPCQANLPNTAALNYTQGVNGGNEIVAQLDSGGRLCLYTSASTHLTVDVVAAQT